MDRRAERSRVEPLLAVPSPPDSRTAELDRALLQLLEELLRATDPDEVASTLLRSAVTTYGFPTGLVLRATGRQLSASASHATAGAPAVGTSAVVQRAQQQGTSQVLGDLRPDDEPFLAQLLPHGSDLVVVPLTHDQVPLGALVLQVPTVLRGHEGRRTLAQLERWALYGSLALSRTSRLVQLERLAATDDLTKIANRRSFFMSLEREIARARRRDEPVSLVMLDLDGFKQINDVHGHPAGDDALRNVAAALSIACRDLDTPARYGGEEFVVILPDCTTESAVVIAERLRDAVAAAPAVTRLRASAGIASLPDHASEAESLVAAADAALLQAKRSGRDRVVVAAAPPGRDRSAGADLSDDGNDGGQPGHVRG